MENQEQSEPRISEEHTNRDIEDMLTTWLIKLTDRCGDGLRFVQVMTNTKVLSANLEAMFESWIKNLESTG